MAMFDKLQGAILILDGLRVEYSNRQFDKLIEHGEGDVMKRKLFIEDGRGSQGLDDSLGENMSDSDEFEVQSLSDIVSISPN